MVAVGIVAAVLVVFALQVLGTARELASEVKLMQEALQITVRESLSTNKLPQLTVCPLTERSGPALMKHWKRRERDGRGGALWHRVRVPGQLGRLGVAR